MIVLKNQPTRKLGKPAYAFPDAQHQEFPCLTNVEIQKLSAGIEKRSKLHRSPADNNSTMDWEGGTSGAFVPKEKGCGKAGRAEPQPSFFLRRGNRQRPRCPINSLQTIIRLRVELFPVGIGTLFGFRR